MIPLPDKKYSIIYADPPWSYQNRGTRAAASKHYDTMTIEDIKRMGVGAAGGIANEDCVLFMWATFPMLREAAPGWDVWGNEAPTPEVKDAPADSVELAGKEETHEPDNQRDPAPQL